MSNLWSHNTFHSIATNQSSGHKLSLPVNHVLRSWIVWSALEAVRLIMIVIRGTVKTVRLTLKTAVIVTIIPRVLRLGPTPRAVHVVVPGGGPGVIWGPSVASFQHRGLSVKTVLHLGGPVSVCGGWSSVWGKTVGLNNLTTSLTIHFSVCFKFQDLYAYLWEFAAFWHSQHTYLLFVMKDYFVKH